MLIFSQPVVEASSWQADDLALIPFSSHTSTLKLAFINLLLGNLNDRSNVENEI